MKSVGIIALLTLLVTFAVEANGPVNKATGHFIQGHDNPNIAIDFTAHEGVVMKNGKTRPAKGMLTAYNLTNADRYYAVNITCVNVISETDAVFVGPVLTAGPDWAHWVGFYRLNWVHDGGEPGAFTDEFHTSMVENPVDAMEFCTNPPDTPDEMGRHWNVFEGNIQVHYRAPD